MKISFPWTLWRYLAIRYMVQIAIVGVSLLSLVYIFETMELMRRASNHGVGLTSVLGMALLKLPETAQILFPFIFLISGLSLFWQLGRASELVVMRAVGISAWQFVAPVILVAFLFGVFNIGLLQPIGAASLKRYTALETEYFGKPRRIASINTQGLWLREASSDGSVRLLHASKIGGNGEELDEVMVLTLNHNGQLRARMDADSGRFEDTSWILQNGTQTDANGQMARFTTNTIKTDLNRAEMFSGFNEAATFSSWELPRHIETMAVSGFPTRSLILYYQNLLATPFLWVAMALIAAVVSLTPHRFGKTTLMIGLGLLAGFFYFMFARYFEALSLTQRIPAFVAAWVPVIVATIIPVTSLLKREDG